MSEIDRIKQAMADGEHTDGDLQWAVSQIVELNNIEGTLSDEIKYLRRRIAELDKDVNGLMTLLAKEKAENERLRAALNEIAETDIDDGLEMTRMAEQALKGG